MDVVPWLGSLTGRPGHGASAEDVTMHMVHGLLRVLAGVEHQPVPGFGDTVEFRDVVRADLRSCGRWLCWAKKCSHVYSISFMSG